MRTCLIAAFATVLSATFATAQPQGVVFVGDMQSIDRAVLDAADLPLPAVGSTARKPAPAAQSGGVRPVAYHGGMQARAGQQGGMRPTTQAEPPRKTLFGSLKAPAWLTGKKKATAPTVDPFNNAALTARQNAGAKLRDQNLQPIPSYVGQSSGRPVSAAAYQPRPGQSRNGQSRMNQPQPAQVQQPKRSSGLALRKEAGPRAGLLSGLFGEKKSMPTPAAQPTSRRPAARQVPSSRPNGMVYSSGPSASSKSASNTLRKTAPKSTTPRPVQRVASRTAPTKPAALRREPSGVATVISSSSSEPAGSVVMISDTPVTSSKPIAKKTIKRAPLPLVVGPQSKPIAPKQVLSSHPMEFAPRPASPTPLIVTDKQAKPIETAPPLVASKPTPSYARTTPRKAVRPKPVDLQPVAAEPSERSRALLAEAHGLAATAASYEEFSAVVQRCRYVLAIDQSDQAHAYANQLAGWALTKRGDRLETEGRHEEAQNDFHDALACDPECWRAIHALGVSAARVGDADEARRRFDETLEMNPEYAKAYSNRAALAVQGGDYQSALHDYQRAIEVDPDMAIAHTGRGRVCHMLGLLGQGLRHLDAAAMLDPADAMIAIGRGDLLTDLGRYGQALKAYERAIELEPSLAAAHRNLAWMQATCPVESFRDGDSALQHAETAEQLAEGSDDLTLDTKAAALAAVGRFEEAMQLQRDAIELAPESDASVYLERLSMYERGESFTSKPVAVRQATYTK